ncbi:MAG: ATP-binding protein [Saprospiraceae bacterium]|nr:ATP-binding protein [Saprospiraceae bacterium]
MYNRNQVFIGSEEQSLFLWGVRQTGKSTLLKQMFSNAMVFDLLKNDVLRRLARRPEEFREAVLADDHTQTIIIDEIQKIPELLNEVHWLIENTNKRYILSGSSPRKILGKGINLLGGRALRYELYPLSFSEIPDFDILKALNQGLLPKHYDAKNYQTMLSAYIGAYLEEEILAETKIRDLQVFSGFLEKAAFANGEMVNYTNIAADCGVSSPTIKEYYKILKETMIGRYVEPFQKKPKRRVIQAPKFYFFDVGIANFLLKRKNLVWGTETIGFAFEHFIYMELHAYSNYSGKHFPIYYWRTTSQIEVDFILGDSEVALEIKSTNQVHSKHFKGLKAFNEEYSVSKNIVISNDPYPRKIDNMNVMPWKYFLEKLWAGLII